MNVNVQGSSPMAPFLSAKESFETDYDLEHPVSIELEDDPETRTRVGHGDERHRLTISRAAASSAMARELILHEFAHMHLHETEHPSHTTSTEEALFLALSGKSVERRVLTQCYQIANHMRDIYADDLTLSLCASEKLVAFFESKLAATLRDTPTDTARSGHRITAGSDPQIGAVNAAFALALLERNDAIDSGHRIYDLGRAIASQAPAVEIEAFKQQFKSLQTEPTTADFRRELVSSLERYVSP